jgi:hypothetical protein
VCEHNAQTRRRCVLTTLVGSVRRWAILRRVGRVNADANVLAIMRAGRWVSTSSAFLVYYEEGATYKWENLNISASEDPIKRFWIWVPITYHEIPSRMRPTLR